jgi:hypothetical protein
VSAKSNTSRFCLNRSGFADTGSARYRARGRRRVASLGVVKGMVIAR